LDKLLNDAVQYDKSFDQFRVACNFVEEFYTEQRYPFIPSPVPSRADFDAVRKKIEEMIAFILQPQNP